MEVLEYNEYLVQLGPNLVLINDRDSNNTTDMTSVMNPSRQKVILLNSVLLQPMESIDLTVN